MLEHCHSDDGVLADLVEWLVFETAPNASTVELLHGFAQRLCQAGFDLIRLNLQVRPLSPQVASRVYVWRPTAHAMELSPLVNVVGSEEQYTLDGGQVQVTALAHGAFQTAAWRASPGYRLLVEEAAEVRSRIAANQTDFAFPILKDLQAQGATDYFALPMQFYGSALSAISFATQKSGGFSDADLAVLREARRPLLLALSPRLEAHTMRTLLGAYLGPKTANLVLAGTVERGDVEEIEAAIWFSDLRGFTPMSAGISSSELIAWLNEYFAAVGRAIVGHDGEILKFIGDAILAVWPVSALRSRDETCRAALAAAKAANVELDALNAQRQKSGLSALQHGIGLHVGSAQYGNIGAEGRLDFTVIGAAVNTAARLESVCAKLARRVIASHAFAECAGGEMLPLAMTELKGISEPQRVFGIAE
ncbi:MAG TPA: adenylate/guanylate cyclase domain-containing protein [Polyangiaceae bacterium]|jgi:adenylate cyclase